ncbi:MAG: hypothetical protein U0R24_09080 [Solirubrobacterales bacterium]
MRFRPAVAFLDGDARFRREADAADRYAEPGGNGPQASCPQSDPCGILDAVEGPAAQNGDKVLLSPGTTRRARPSTSPASSRSSRPTRRRAAGDSATTGGFAVDVSVSQVGLGGVEIRGGGSGGLHLGGGIYGQLLVSSPGGPACYLEDSNPSSPVTVWLNDSTCLNTGGSPFVAARRRPGRLGFGAAHERDRGLTRARLHPIRDLHARSVESIPSIDRHQRDRLRGGIDAWANLNNTALTSSIDLDHSNFDSSTPSAAAADRSRTGSSGSTETVPAAVRRASRGVICTRPRARRRSMPRRQRLLMTSTSTVIRWCGRRALDIGSSDEWVPEDVVVHRRGHHCPRDDADQDAEEEGQVSGRGSGDLRFRFQ